MCRFGLSEFFVAIVSPNWSFLLDLFPTSHLKIPIYLSTRILFLRTFVPYFLDFLVYHQSWTLLIENA